ncbi:MAG: cobalt ECF transporter T component CbiQ [Betaproteobacteria bacterium]|nr:cobalt ECF transporter T component CbiQ [Betaproteobacteria bacterium]
MMALAQRLLDFRALDLLAGGVSAVHRIDARAKVLVALVFLICVTSFERHALAPLLPYFAFPIVVAAWAGLPAGLVARKAALVLPFALAVGIASPWFERHEIARLAGFEFSAGWLSLASIVLRSLLAGAAAVVLVAVTGFPSLCGALARLGVPRPFVVQLMFLYRYLTVLGEEAARMMAAREQRACGRRLSLAGFGVLAGQLLLRSFDRAQRIYRAMRARGFDGEFHGGTPARLSGHDVAAAAGCCALLVALRVGDVAGRLGELALGGWR